MFKNACLEGVTALLMCLLFAVGVGLGTAAGNYITLRQYTFSQGEIREGVANALKPIFIDLDTLKRKVYPEAVKVSEANNNCAVDIKTMKCEVQPATNGR